jgi:superfamily I DNA/RNA helicase
VFEEDDVSEPSIMLTSLMGSKGMQAAHVFVVGVNDGHFPRQNDAITNEEVCQLLVALTRTRKSCSLVSTGNLAGEWKQRSRFIDWLQPHIEERTINKQFFEADQQN